MGNNPPTTPNKVDSRVAMLQEIVGLSIPAESCLQSLIDAGFDLDAAMDDFFSDFASVVSGGGCALVSLFVCLNTRKYTKEGRRGEMEGCQAH